MEKTGRARRRLIQALIVAGAGFPLWRFLTPKSIPAAAVVRVPRTSVPSGGALVFREERVALLRGGDEIYALSLACTHLGCTVTVTPRELVCPCHGSSFSRSGEVLRGPAARPLPRLAVREEGDDVLVFG